MKTSKLFLVGVILASSVSFSFARPNVECYLATMLRHVYNMRVNKCVNGPEKKSLDECKVIHQSILDRSNKFERICQRIRGF